MKIICVDNFNRDYINDRLICDNVSETDGNEIVKLLNNSEETTSDNFYKLVANDYKLHVWEP